MSQKGLGKYFHCKEWKINHSKLGNILHGITRESIMQVATDLGIHVEEKKIIPKDVYEADEAFFTGTAAEVTFIDSLDDKKIGNGKYPIAEKIKNKYMDIVHGKIRNMNHG
jgi:branched-chain amino acid aminotransferase